VNHQRSAHAKGRLKHEFVVKLEQIGLKWSMSDEQLKAGDFDDDFEGEEFTTRDHARKERKLIEEEKRSTEKLIKEGRMATTEDTAALVKLVGTDAMKYAVALDAIYELKAHASRSLDNYIRKEEYNQEGKDARLLSDCAMLCQKKLK
jgi:hypothetical protein